MSSPDRRAVLALGGAVLLAGGCGFRPLYGEAGDVYGKIALQEANDPDSYAFRERLRRRVGDAGEGAELGLSYRIVMEEDGVAVTPDSDVTRYQIAATATWRLTRLSTGEPVQSGEVTTRGAYDATSAPYATRAAQRAEREELSTELAELVAVRVLAAGSS